MARRSPDRAWRVRTGVFSVAAVISGLDLTIKLFVSRELDSGRLDLGFLDVRVASNSGVAFSLGADLPPNVIVAFTAAITMVLACLAWWLAPTLQLVQRAGLAALLGGALANLLDRAGDGFVVDYLATGWWPTFNFADVAICSGAGLLIIGSLATPVRTSTRDAAQVLPESASR